MGIVQNLEKILQARYGRDVRQAIHDSISDLNEIANTAQTSAKAYYEGTQRLAQTISGNVGIDDSTATLGTTYSSHKIENKTRTNLLNPILETKTINGITCTNNGDGTYTLNGTASAEALFNIIPWGAGDNRYVLGDGANKLRLVGCPKGGSTSTFVIQALDVNSSNLWVSDIGNGVTFDTVDGKFTAGVVRISIQSGVTCNNLLFKPMLTTDLSATYNDYVQYSGNGELNANVAEMYKTIETLKNAITELGGTV